MGKGLMTVWRATNPHAGDIPTGIDFADVEVTGVSPNSSSVSHGSPVQVRRPLKQNFRTVSHLTYFSHVLFSCRYLDKYLLIVYF